MNITPHTIKAGDTLTLDMVSGRTKYARRTKDSFTNILIYGSGTDRYFDVDVVVSSATVTAKTNRLVMNMTVVRHKHHDKLHRIKTAIDIDDAMHWKGFANRVVTHTPRSMNMGIAYLTEL